MNFNGQNIVISLLFCIIVFAVNFVIPSGINGFPKSGLNYKVNSIYENNVSEKVFWSRYNDSEFRRRPFVLELQKILYEQFQVPFQLSFNILNFIFLFLVFLILPYLGSILGSANEDSIYGQTFLLISMPVIFSFLANMCSYDDFIQYFLIICFLISYYLGFYYISILLLLLSCICRETSIVFFLIIIYNEYKNKGIRSLFSTKIIVSISFIVISYLLYLKLYLPDYILVKSKNFLLEERLQAWKGNFGTKRKFSESVSIIFTQLSMITLLLTRKIRKSKDLETEEWYKFLLVFLYFNCLIICFTGLVREARLIFLPMLLIIPLMQTEFKMIVQILPKLIQRKSLIDNILVITFSFFIAFIFYKPFTNGTGIIYKLYMFIYLFVYFNIALPSHNILFKYKKILNAGYFKK